MQNSIDAKQQLLLNALQAFPPANIYLLGPKDSVARAYALYRNAGVASFGWSKDHACLIAWIKVPRAYAANVFLNDRQGLSFSCSCGVGTTSSLCAHVIAALLTIKNLLQPGLFRLPESNEKRREALLSGMYGFVQEPRNGKSAGSPPGYAVMLDADQGTDLEVYVMKNGQRLPGNFAWAVPALRELWLPPYTTVPHQLAAFIRYLERHENLYPLIVKAAGQSTQVTFDPLLSYTAKTELDVAGEKVSISKQCISTNGDEQVIPMNRLVFHPETRLLGVIRDTEGWSPWNEYRQLASRDATLDDAPDLNGRSFQIALTAFMHYQLTYPRDHQDRMREGLVLKIDGAPSPLVRGMHTYRMSARPSMDAEQSFSLKAECVLGAASLPPSRRTFSFFDHLRLHLPKYLSVRKRSFVLCRAFFELTQTAAKTAKEKIIKSALAEADIHKYVMKRETREFLASYDASFTTEEEQLVFHAGAWTTVPVDKQKELLMYKAAFEVYNKYAFERMPAYNVMLIPAGVFIERLPRLAARLHEQGIELVLNDKPVMQARWEITIDASRGSDIDWFELKPEVRCNGTLVEAAGLNAALQGSGFIELGESVQMLDADIRDILTRLSGLNGPSSKPGREREIVKIPRLQILDWMSLRRAGVTIKLAPEDEVVIERLLRFDRIEQKPLPVKLLADLRPYQREGYDWLAFLYEHRFGACLADDMGLGKTVQAISLLGGLKEGLILSHAKEKPLPHLIVVPPSLLFNWEHELKKFYPDLSIQLHTGNNRRIEFDGCDIVLTTYHIVRQDIELLHLIAFDVIVFDEAQLVKNIHAGMTSAARRLSACFKLALTGTPLENHINEYYSIIDLSLPGLIGDYRTFRSLVKADAAPALDTLIRRTRPFVLRRTKENVLKELPSKIENDVYLDLTDAQKTLYTRTVELVRRTIDDAFREKAQAQAKIIALTAILKLRQICLSPRLLSPDLMGPSPKIDFLVENLREVLDEGHSALVFSQFTSFLNIAEHDLEKSGIAYLRLDGSTPVARRKTLVKEFQSHEGPSVFLLSLKAGGKGLNLTRASYVFHLDPWWNPAVEDQASDRAHRIGQEQSVTITRILMRNTIEEKMMELKQKKMALYRAIMDGVEGSGKNLSVTRDDFQFLLDT